MFCLRDDSLLGQCSAKDGDVKASLTAAGQKGSLAVLLQAMAVIAMFLQYSKPPWLFVHRTTGFHGVPAVSRNWSQSLTALVRDRFLYRFESWLTGPYSISAGSANWGAVLSTVSCCAVIQLSRVGSTLRWLVLVWWTVKGSFTDLSPAHCLRIQGTSGHCSGLGYGRRMIRLSYLPCQQRDPHMFFCFITSRRLTRVLSFTCLVTSEQIVCVCISAVIWPCTFFVTNIFRLYSFSVPSIIVINTSSLIVKKRCLVSPSDDWPSPKFYCACVLVFLLRHKISSSVCFGGIR